MRDCPPERRDRDRTAPQSSGIGFSANAAFSRGDPSAASWQTSRRFFPVPFEFANECSPFACIVWLRLLHIFDVSEQCSPMIEPVAVGHIISCTSDGIVVFMNMSLLRPLF